MGQHEVRQVVECASPLALWKKAVERKATEKQWRGLPVGRPKAVEDNRSPRRCRAIGLSIITLVIQVTNRNTLLMNSGSSPPATSPFAFRGWELFLSYSRKDDQDGSRGPGTGWVTAFAKELKARHQGYSRRELRIFFDTESIDAGRDWRRVLGEGLRSSRLFLAFLSPNYIISENCLWEWEEYLRREHSAARGDDGITPIFFVTPDSLSAGDDQRIARWLADLKRRNRTHDLEFEPWFGRGPEILRQLDAAERSGELKQSPRDSAHDLRTLSDRLDALGRRIAIRLDRIALADLAPGNVVRGTEHFVGRHRELSELHTSLTTGGPQSGGRGMGGLGMIAAAHSPGGLGKTALARQYAHAYAEFYAAGGTWEVPCEGIKKLGLALLHLADSPRLRTAGEGLVAPLVLNEDERNSSAKAAEAVFDYLRRLTHARVHRLREELQRHPERHSPDADLPLFEKPRCLLILDNIDQVEMLSAAQAKLIPAEEWLEVLVTTRMNPADFGLGDRWQVPFEVQPLTEIESLNLLRDFQPGHRFGTQAEDAQEEASAREIVRALGGYTIAVELVAAYLGARAITHYRPSHYLARLQEEGSVKVDALAEDKKVSQAIVHSETPAQNQIRTLIMWSLERLSAPARSTIEYASLFLPDWMPTAWLEFLVRQRHPEAMTDQEIHPAKWPEVWQELYGLRLLHPAEARNSEEDTPAVVPRLVRIHRLVADHVDKANPNSAQTWNDIDGFLTALGGLFEQQVGQGNDEWLRAQHPWLRDQLSHLISRNPTITLLRQAQVAADFEGEHLTLTRALDLTAKVLAAKKMLLLGKPESVDLQRDVSVSLDRLGDFLASRGQPGDAEQALAHYQRSLEVSERLLADNPQSAQAARDVLVSLERMANCESMALQHARALAFQERVLEISRQLYSANPGNWAVGRTIIISLIRTSQFAGNANDSSVQVERLAECYAVLRQFHEGGTRLDPQMIGLYQQLHGIFN